MIGRRILFYAINGVGLGHVVRLAQFEAALRAVYPRYQLFFYSNSAKVRTFLACDGVLVQDNPDLSWAERSMHILAGFERVVQDFRPDVVVCDTHWPKPHVQILRKQGVRTALILRLLRSGLMGPALEEAREAFDVILLPHDPDELLGNCEVDLQTLEHLCSNQCGFIGPIARVCAAKHSGPRRVIFSLGGGGEYHNASKGNRKNDYIRTFVRSAGMLAASHEVYLAIGAFMTKEELGIWPYKVLKTMELHTYLDPTTTVVSRPGYNTCWEAIAAGARLVLVGSHVGMEDTVARAQYLERRKLAKRVPLNASAIARAVSQDDGSRLDHTHWAERMRAGLRVAISDVLGEEFLRDAQVRSLASLRRRPHSEQLLAARFDDVDVSCPTEVLVRAAKVAMRTGFQLQLHCLFPSGKRCSPEIIGLLSDGAELWSHGRHHERGRSNRRGDFLVSIRALEDKTGCRVEGISAPYDESVYWWYRDPLPGKTLSVLHGPVAEKNVDQSVDICHFPGPRVRSELWIAAELARLGRRSGLCFHVDRIPSFVTEHFLYCFAPAATK